MNNYFQGSRGSRPGNYYRLESDYPVVRVSIGVRSGRPRLLLPALTFGQGEENQVAGAAIGDFDGTQTRIFAATLEKA
jgi:hypothetical protein